MYDGVFIQGIILIIFIFCFLFYFYFFDTIIILFDFLSFDYLFFFTPYFPTYLKTGRMEYGVIQYLGEGGKIRDFLGTFCFFVTCLPVPTNMI